MSQKQAPSSTADRYLLRLKPGMRSTIKQHAAANNRTMNAEMISLLEKGMEICYGEKSNG